MSGIEAGLAVVFLATFLVGVTIGLVIMVAIAIRRDSLTAEPPDATTRGARRLTGVGIRDIIYTFGAEPSDDRERVQ
jgi:hypothetical protein